MFDQHYRPPLRASPRFKRAKQAVMSGAKQMTFVEAVKPLYNFETCIC